MTPPPPIARPHEAPTSPTKAPFRGIQLFVAADALLGIGSLVGSYNSPSSPLSRAEIGEIAFFVGAVVVLWVLLLWKMWSGSNVARLLFWFLSVGAVISLVCFGFDNENAPFWVRAIDTAQAAFLSFALVWLLLPGVKAHFRRAEAV